jgi:predicted P-loop ATPase
MSVWGQTLRSRSSPTAEDKNLQSYATDEQAERYQGDAWEEPIRKWLAKPRESYPRLQPILEVSVGEVLEKALDIEPSRWTQGDQNRVVRCLISMGFRKCRPRNTDGKREHRYRRDDDGSIGPGVLDLGPG